MKDVDRGLEFAGRAYRKRTREYKARTSKAEFEAFEAKQKVREVIETIINGRKDSTRV